MADKTNEILKQLLTGQHRLEIDVTGLKEGQKKLESNVSGLKTDVAELKEGQKRTQLLLLNMENRIMPIINATYENSKLSEEQIDSIRKTQSEHGKRKAALIF